MRQKINLLIVFIAVYFRFFLKNSAKVSQGMRFLG